MSESGYDLVFSEGATEFLVQLPKGRQKKVVTLAARLAAHPLVRSDYSIRDESGREIEHLMMADYVFAYWLDHAAREIRITDIDDAS